MRTTISIDDRLLAEAKRYSGCTKISELIEKGLKALIACEAADRLAALGGTEPSASVAPRRETPSLLAEEPSNYDFLEETDTEL